MPRSKLIFDKSYSIHSRTKECKKLSSHVKTEKFRSIVHQCLLKGLYVFSNPQWRWYFSKKVENQVWEVWYIENMSQSTNTFEIE